MIMDFSRYPISNRFYGGSEKKIGIVISGQAYMLKFQKITAFGKRNNHISEFIGSHVFSMLGFPTQETHLGMYKGEQVVACKDFIEPGIQFVPFNDVGESTLDQGKERYQYSYEDIMQMLKDNTKLTQGKQTIEAFWEIFIIDSLLGNSDRHGSNWGFLKTDNKYQLAPVFDNGACLFPSMTDEHEMLKVIASKAETEKRVFSFPTSQIKLNGQKSSYFEVIHSCLYLECNNALEAVYNRLDMQSIEDLINETPFISETHKLFYKHMLTMRYELIIQESYSKLKKVAP